MTNKILAIAIMAVVCSGPAIARDRVVELHTPRQEEIKILGEILAQSGHLDAQCSGPAYAEKFPEECLRLVKWHVAQVRLDQAPEPEFVLFGDGLGWCGTDCSFEIFKKYGTRWKVVFSEYANSTSIKLSESVTNGFRDVKQSDDRYFSKYDGAKYVCNKCDEYFVKTGKLFPTFQDKQ